MSVDTVLITGASSGIGLELARCFAAEGCRLALVARKGNALEALASELRKAHKIQAQVITADLAQPEAPTRLLAHLQAAGLKVDVLVNNAGIGAQGRFAQLPLGRQLEMLQVNITSLTHLTGLLLPGMLERRRGGVLNVASTAAFQPGPGMTVYYATKAYVLSFSEALAEELAGTGVSVTAVCPGPTATNFGTVANMRTLGMVKKVSMTAEAVARLGHRAFRRGKAVAVTGLRNQIPAFLVRVVPRAVVRKITKRLNNVNYA
ncbi:MAG TPA: SDR family oxidoreductase [Candidatus Paceibacterota bacterium]|nr:SDR family oxidoreductase [Verrucomicrobiota bacterium]HSA09689.1 SDR family oxidoreductase [Candidatus Paceibacterota bacterium]